MNQFESMQHFVRIVEAGSISKAAEQMGKAKSAVSRRLNELESYLGVTLLVRTTRRLTLTESGQHYYQECLKILDDLANMESHIRNDDTALAGQIKMATPLSFGLRHLQPALTQFNQMHPNISYDIDLNDRQIDLIEEGFHLAIRIAHLKDSSLIAKKLAHTRLILSASPDYLKQQGTPQKPENLTEGYHLLRYRAVNNQLSFKNTKGNEYKIKIPTKLTTNNGDYLYQAALKGQGLLLSPDFICYQAIKTGQLIPLFSEALHDYTMGIYAVYPSHRHISLKIRHLIDFLAHYFKKNAHWNI